MATSEVEIVNSALGKIGGARIISLDDDSKEARLMKDAFPLKRDELLRSHPWNFAIDRIQLAEDVTTPVYGFDKQFVIPLDTLRIFDVSDGTSGDSPTFSARAQIIPFQKEGNLILTDLSTVFVRRLKRVETVASWDVNFVEVLALLLAANAAYAIAQSTTLSNNLYGIYDAFLGTARSYDAQEGSIRRVVASDFINSRFQRGPF